MWFFIFLNLENHNFFKQLKSSKYYTENQVLFIMNPFFNIRLSDETEIRLNSLTQFCTEGSVLESEFYKHCFSTGKELTFGDSYGNDKEIIPMAKKEYQPSSLFDIPGNREFSRFINELFIGENFQIQHSNECERQNDLQNLFKDATRNRRFVRHKFKYMPETILIKGTSGTGKSYCINKVAEDFGIRIFKLDSSVITDSSIHGASQQIGEVFDHALEHMPSIVLLDNADAIFRDRMYVKDDNTWTGEEVTALLSKIDEVRHMNITVVITTTAPDLIDHGIIDKVEHTFEMKNPDECDVRNLLLHELESALDEDALDYTSKYLASRKVSNVCKFIGVIKKLMADKRIKKISYQTAVEELKHFDGFNLDKDAVFKLDGQKEFEDYINSNIVPYLKSPECFRAFDACPLDPIMMHGLPGTGKTTAALAVKDFLKWNYVYLSGQNIGCYSSSASKKVNESFKKARDCAPTVLFIDEADVFFKKRDSNSNNELISEFLRNITADLGKDRILLLAATNRIDDIDDAILRNGRFPKKSQIEFKFPDEESILEALNTNLGKFPCSENLNFSECAKKLAGRPLSDFGAYIKDVCINASKRQSNVIEQCDLDLALKNMKEDKNLEKGKNPVRHRIGFI